jgi:hypothetical protein
MSDCIDTSPSEFVVSPVSKYANLVVIAQMCTLHYSLCKTRLVPAKVSEMLPVKTEGRNQNLVGGSRHFCRRSSITAVDSTHTLPNH